MLVTISILLMISSAATNFNSKQHGQKRWRHIKAKLAAFNTMVLNEYLYHTYRRQQNKIINNLHSSHIQNKIINSQDDLQHCGPSSELMVTNCMIQLQEYRSLNVK